MIQIEVKTSFEATHYWPDASGKYECLKHPHLHEFSVIVRLEVMHGDREVEFYALRDEVRECCRQWEGEIVTESCEQFAWDIAAFLQAKYPGRERRVGVFEDNGFGAWVME